MEYDRLSSCIFVQATRWRFVERSAYVPAIHVPCAALSVDMWPIRLLHAHSYP